MKPKLSVPYIDEDGFLAEVLGKNKEGIGEIYLPLPSRHAGSGRAIYCKDLDYETIIGKCHSKDVKVDVLLNSSCDGIEPYTPDGVDGLMAAIERVVECKADVLTVANPLYIEKVKDCFDVEVKVSVISKVDCQQKAVFFERMGADSINLDRDINRDLETIEQIRDAVDCKLFLLVNEGCILKCPFKHFHDNLIGHISRIPPMQRENIDLNPFAAYCEAIRRNEPAEILKSPWIRPEDLHLYEGLVDGFKIAGRDLDKDNMARIVEAYSKENYDGDLMDLLNVKTPGFRIPNKSLQKIHQKLTSCSRDCHRCSYCNELAEKVVEKIGA